MSNDHRSEVRALRMELLRMRATMQRAEVAHAVAELRGSAAPLRSAMSGLGGLGAGVAARSGWVGLAAGLMRRPWVAAMALSAVRALKRRPVLGTAAVVAGLAAWGAFRISRFGAESSTDPGARPRAARPAPCRTPRSG